MASAPDYVLMLFVAHQRQLSFVGLVLDEKETLTKYVHTEHQNFNSNHQNVFTQPLHVPISSLFFFNVTVYEGEGSVF